jgi:hypothetical protein
MDKKAVPSPAHTAIAVSVRMIMIRVEALLARVKCLESTLFSRTEYLDALGDIVVEKQMIIMAITKMLAPGANFEGDTMLREVLTALG